MASEGLDHLLWIAILGGVCGFGYGFLIGANDLANAFASSVASKSITLKQAVIIASIFEFCGALFLGASVTSTIRSKIVDISLYEDEPDILMLGMFTSLFSAIIMLWLATAFGLPVSTTHDIVACIMGFSIAAKGFDSVDWEVARTIFVSWAASPLLSGAVGAFIFASTKFGVLRSQNPYQRAFWTFPLVLTIGVGIDLFYILYKGTSNFKDFNEGLTPGFVLPIAFGTGAGCGLLWIFIFGPITRRRIEAKEAAAETEKAGALEDGVDVVKDGEKMEEASSEEIVESPDETNKTDATAEVPLDAADAKSNSRLQQAIDNFGERTFKQDLHAQSMSENPRAAQIWEDSEKFDEKAESLFSYIQVFTACCFSFAHGANDVSNTIAPLSAIIMLYQTASVDSKAPVQKWVLAYGGAAIVVGLLLYGYKVMKSLGYKLTYLSPSRGASAELAASLVVVTASFREIPVSSTQCIVGAVSGVGLVSGFRNVQWLFLLKVSLGWVVMFFAAALLSAGVFSLLAFSPSLI